jgi:enamine deaminase RidA (YjgF/YER057c/UK114 family)
MTRITINTPFAPMAIGTYSQAILADKTLYLSGQIPINPETQSLEHEIETAIHQVFKNLSAVIHEAGKNIADLQQDWPESPFIDMPYLLKYIVKLNIYLTDLKHFSTLNQIMSNYFVEPFPARAAIQVSALPKDACVEMDAVAIFS